MMPALIIGQMHGLRHGKAAGSPSLSPSLSLSLSLSHVLGSKRLDMFRVSGPRLQGTANGSVLLPL